MGLWDTLHEKSLILRGVAEGCGVEGGGHR